MTVREKEIISKHLRVEHKDGMVELFENILNKRVVQEANGYYSLVITEDLDKDINPEHQQKIISSIPMDNIKKYAVIIDNGNGEFK